MGSCQGSRNRDLIEIIFDEWIVNMSFKQIFNSCQILQFF